jgi:ankyrin repeat protein
MKLRWDVELWDRLANCPRGKRERTAVMAARVKWLLQRHNVSIFALDKVNKATALHLAAQGNHAGAIDVLLQSQEELHQPAQVTQLASEAKDRHAALSIHSAAPQGFLVDVRDVEGRTPLLSVGLNAASINVEDVSKLVASLLDHGADPAAVDIYGWSVAQRACATGQHSLYVRALQKYPKLADMATKDTGETPFS